MLYVDTDAHHGDGVQFSFYDDPDACTFSIHETGRYLFPGTGSITERGTGEAYGTSFNIPIDAFTEEIPPSDFSICAISSPASTTSPIFRIL